MGLKKYSDNSDKKIELVPSKHFLEQSMKNILLYNKIIKKTIKCELDSRREGSIQANYHSQIQLISQTTHFVV